jgi:hypothetical protein
MTIYCLDANFFITPWRTYYSPYINPDYWALLESLAREGKIFTPMEIYEELSAGGDDLFDWIKQHKDIFVRTMDENVQQELVNLFLDPAVQELIDTKKKKNLADPFLLAYGKAYKATVVANDRRVKTICIKYNIECIKDFEFIQQNNITFSLNNPNH